MSEFIHRFSTEVGRDLNGLDVSRIRTIRLQLIGSGSSDARNLERQERVGENGRVGRAKQDVLTAVDTFGGERDIGVDECGRGENVVPPFIVANQRHLLGRITINLDAVGQRADKHAGHGALGNRSTGRRILGVGIN